MRKTAKHAAAQGLQGCGRQVVKRADAGDEMQEIFFCHTAPIFADVDFA
jgi:hypothetical protein